MTNLTLETLHKMIEEVPNIDPLTGMEKCELYTFDDEVVYVPVPAYDAYTFPEYDSVDKSFYHWHYDMDYDNRKEYEYICDLFDAIHIKGFYENNQKYWHISNDIIRQTLKDYCDDEILDKTEELYSKINDIKDEIQNTKKDVIDSMNKSLPDAWKITE